MPRRRRGRARTGRSLQVVAVSVSCAVKNARGRSVGSPIALASSGPTEPSSCARSAGGMATPVSETVPGSAPVPPTCSSGVLPVVSLDGMEVMCALSCSDARAVPSVVLPCVAPFAFPAV